MRDPLTVVLTYHSISRGPKPLCIAPHELERHLDMLAGAGFEPLPLAELVHRLSGDRPLPRRSFALTFDDGYRNFRQAALPLLARRGLPSTLFVTAASDRGGLSRGTGEPLLALDELPELARSDVEIGAHSVSHADLTAIDDDALERELTDCRQILEGHAGRAVEHFAYPFGRFDARVRIAVGERFSTACTCRLAAASPGLDPLSIPRVDAYYLGSPLLTRLLAWGHPEPYLGVRGWLRRLRGSEPRGEPRSRDLPASV